jgi:hypothetical protein
MAEREPFHVGRHQLQLASSSRLSITLTGTRTMEPAISLTATSEEIAAIRKLAQEAEGVDAVSEPAALDSTRALNAGLTPEDVRTALEIVTVIFKTGAALFVFLKTVRDYVSARGGVVGVSDAPGTKPLGRIEPTTADEVITRLLPP